MASPTSSNVRFLRWGDVGDLALLDAGGGRGGRVPGAQRVPGELVGIDAGAERSALDDQRDRLV